MAYSRPEPLRAEHRLEGFRSGERSLDSWLLRHSRTAQGTGSARVFVTTVDPGRVVGLYALSAGAVGAAESTERLRKGQPAARPVPIVILGRLAVDGEHQRKGLGTSLLQDGLLRVATAAESIGVRAVVVHAVNEAARRWYLRWGFEPSPTDSFHLILLLKDLKRLLGEAGEGS